MGIVQAQKLQATFIDFQKDASAIGDLDGLAEAVESRHIAVRGEGLEEDPADEVRMGEDVQNTSRDVRLRHEIHEIPDPASELTIALGPFSVDPVRIHPVPIGLPSRTALLLSRVPTGDGVEERELVDGPCLHGHVYEFEQGSGRLSGTDIVRYYDFADVRKHAIGHGFGLLPSKIRKPDVPRPIGAQTGVRFGLSVAYQAYSFQGIFFRIFTDRVFESAEKSKIGPSCS